MANTPAPTAPLNLNINQSNDTSIEALNESQKNYVNRWDEVYRYLRADLGVLFSDYVRRDGTLSLTGNWNVGGYDITGISKLEAVTAFFGNQTSGSTEIEEDGTLVFNGDAVVWDDWQGPLSSNQKLNPSAHIVTNTAEATETFKSNCDLGDYIFMNPQMPHKWKLGTTIHPHLHWFQTTSAVPNWLIQYRWQRNGEAKTTAWTDHTLTVNGFTYVSGTLCQITEGASPITPPSGYSISDIIQFRVIRDVVNASGEFVGAESSPIDTDALSFDYHYMIDTIGSREEYSK